MYLIPYSEVTGTKISICYDDSIEETEFIKHSEKYLFDNVIIKIRETINNNKYYTIEIN